MLAATMVAVVAFNAITVLSFLKALDLLPMTLPMPTSEIATVFTSGMLEIAAVAEIATATAVVPRVPGSVGNALEIVYSTGVTIYDSCPEAILALTKAIEAFLNLWKDIGNITNIPKSK